MELTTFRGTVCGSHGPVNRAACLHYGQGPGHCGCRRCKKDLLQRNISRQLEQAINERSTVIAAREDKAFIQLVDEELEGISAQVVAPIICEGDAIGAVALMSREPRAKFGDAEMKLASTAAGFLGRQMEG